MASANKSASLFGDTDSSDESVDASKPTKAADNPPNESSDKPADSNDEAPESDREGEGDGGDDEEEKGAPRQPASQSNADLFGDDDSSEDDEFDGNDGIVGKSAEAGADKAAKVLTMSERLGLDDSDDEDAANKQPEEKAPQEKKVYVPPRKMELLDLDDRDPSQQPSLHIVKLPNLVGINSAAYNARTHNPEDEEEYYRGYVHNMIRWRYKFRPDDDAEIIRDSDGNPVRESNARLVKWSDGSYTLHVGQEALEVDDLDSSVPVDAEKAGTALPGFAGINGYLYVSQKARIRPPSEREAKGPGERDDASSDGGEPARPAGTVLECLGRVSSRFAPRPSSLASEAHRNLTLAVRQRNVKRARIAEIVTDFDPEKEKQARIKGKDDLAKSRSRTGRRGGGGGRRRLNESYLEEGEDYSGVNLGRLKRQTMRRDYSDEEDEAMDYGEDSEEEEDEWSKNKKRKRGAALRAARSSSTAQKKKGSVGNFDEDSESSEEGEVVFGEESDEEDGAMFKKKGGGAAKKSDFLDEDDD